MHAGCGENKPSPHNYHLQLTNEGAGAQRWEIFQKIYNVGF